MSQRPARKPSASAVEVDEASEAVQQAMKRLEATVDEGCRIIEAKSHEVLKVVRQASLVDTIPAIQAVQDGAE
jgi:glutamyl-tRNA reductase